MNLFLIGYRCTGKTTVGKALARRLGWLFMDTDRVVVETVGSSIFRMVEENGWPFFREQERKVVKAAATSDCQVVATGGGVVLDGGNISAMKMSGKVVWLTASRNTIETRMRADDATVGSRPSLTDQGRVSEISTVLSQREPLYLKASDLVIATDRVKIATICDRIVNTLGLKPY